MSEGEHQLLVQEDAHKKQSADFVGQIMRYLRFWRIFILCLVIGLVVAYLYNRYTPDVYSAGSKVIVQKEDNQEVDLSVLETGKLRAKGVNFENEGALLQSRRILGAVVDNLELNTLFYTEGNVQTVEVWKEDLPFKVTWIGDDLLGGTSMMDLDFITSTKFRVGDSNGENAKEAMVGDTVNFNGERFIIDLKQSLSNDYLKDKSYLFRRVPMRSAINGLKSGLTIEPYGKESDILSIAYQGPIKSKNETIVDTLVSVYNRDGVTDNQRISKGTERFISERLNLLYEELDTVESGLVDYMQSQGIVTVESSSDRLMGKETEAEQRWFETEMQKQMTEVFKDALVSGEPYSLLPNNMGIDQGSINSLTDRYNQIVLERQERLVSSTRENPKVKNLEERLDELKSNILNSINGYIRDLDLTLETFKSREQESSSRLSQIPEKEKVVRGIMRQQEIKEQLYLFLLQKREEAAMRYAITAPIIKVVDYAYSSGAVAPNREMVYVVAIIVSLIIPFSILYLMFLFDTKIRSREDIEIRLPDIPIMAEIPFVRQDKKLIEANDRSNLAEAFRILRTNLMFFKADASREGKGKVIFSTSTIKGEGKTFVALNIAHSIATTGKKTLVIGADLRNPQTHRYYDLPKEEIGLSNYLSDDSLSMDDLLNHKHKEFKHLDLIIAGPIPPNPAELLMDGRFEQLLEEARSRYDYIIVDTAPTMLVSDTLLVAPYADAMLYMVRADYTRKDLMNHIGDSIKAGKMHHLGLVINGVGEKAGYGYGYGYNYGYGYGYSEGSYIPRWKFWKRRY